MQGRFKMEYRLFTIVQYNYRDYNIHCQGCSSRKYMKLDRDRGIPTSIVREIQQIKVYASNP
jgi:hypothetical protein